MNCWRCNAKMPDGSEVCPICSAIQVRKVSPLTRLKRKMLKWILLASPLVCFAMNALNTYLLVIGAHYVTDMRDGLLTGRYVMYTWFPSLYIMDMILLAALLAIFVVALICTIKVQRKRDSAPIMMLITNICVFLWSLTYLFTALLITDIISPMLGFATMQITVFAIWSVISSICFFRSDIFVY